MAIDRTPIAFAVAMALLTGAAPAAAQIFSNPAPAAKAKPRPKPAVPKRHTRPPRAVAAPAPAPPPAPPPPAYIGAIPRGIVGRWAIDTKSGFMGNEYNNLIVVQGGQVGQIVGRIDYFTAGSNPPHRICSSILTLGSVTNDVVTVNEAMESDGLSCPGDKRVAIQLNAGQLFVTWTKVKKKSDKITMQGWARRIAR